MASKDWDSTKEKAEYDDTQLENGPGDSTPTSESHGILSQFSEQEQKAIMRKVDFRLVPICGLIMTKELQLRKPGVDRYSIITLVFFITYTIFQPPATVLCRKIGPRIFLSAITLAWGIVMIGFGFVQSWVSLVPLRAILGVLEAGFFPGVVYLMSTWYTRYEVGKRYSAFYLIGCVAAAFGGILAFGLMQMEGLAGYGGWRWIFIIEGILTCVVAAIGFTFLLEFPDNSASKSLKFLSADQLKCVIARVNADRGDAELVKFNFKLWARSGADWKIWAYAVIFGSITTSTYALAYFLPIILNLGLGFDVGTSQCLVAPPYVFAGILMTITGWWGDKYHMRGPAVAFNAILTIVGLAIVGFVKVSQVRYFGVFLATAGANANIPTTMAYQANNIRGQWKRAFCSATLVGFGSLGGIVGSTVFRAVDAPNYVPGMVVAMCAQALIVILVGILTWEFKRQNSSADRGEKVLEEGDASFRYTY